MKEFDNLVGTTEHLLGPNGCPWDREQTMKSTRPCVIEEAAELVEAIDSEDNHQIREELGDMLFVALFLSKLAEKEKRCTLAEVLTDLNNKLIRRHPHVFGDVNLNSTEEVLNQWQEIKKTEKGKTHRKSALDSIPKGLPALARAQKVCKKMQNINYPEKPAGEIKEEFTTEEQLGHLLFKLVAKAQNQGLDAEHALRMVLVSSESAFREYELNR